MELNILPPLPRRKDFRIGILGSGFIVDECHLVAYRKAGFNPVAIASRDREHAAEVAQAHGLRTFYDTYNLLLEDPNIEVLDIAVPPQAMLPLIRKACERRIVKGILVQKPLGLSLEEAREAVTLCEAAGITLAVNQNMRFDQSVRAAKTLLENGTIGDPVLATIEMRGIPHWQPWLEELGFVTLRLMSIHHLDTFRYWFGEPLRIFCSTRPDPRIGFRHRDGICAYILEYANGLRCMAIDDTWTGPALEGCPADNYIRWRIEGLDGLAIGSIGWCEKPYTTPSTIRYAGKGSGRFETPVWPESWFPDAFIGTMADLLIALENNTQPTINGHDNLKTLGLVEAAYESARQHQVIVFEPPGDRRTAQVAGVYKHLPPARAEMSNFTPRAQQVLALARREADRFNHNFVGTEHLLVGLIALGQGVAVTVLIKLGLQLDVVRSEIERQIGRGPDQKMIGNIPYTPRVKKVLALAAKEAKALDHTYVGTEHILLGLLLEGDGVSARVFQSFGINAEQTRKEILRELDPNWKEGSKQ